MNTKALRQKILDLAIRGKLVPQDPNDEPASVLLERIRAEKQELIKAGKIKRDKKSSEIFRGASRNLPYAFCEQIGKEIRDISDEIPFEIPDTWEWAKVKDLTELYNGKAFKPSDWSSTGLPIVRIQNLNNEISQYNYFDKPVEEDYRLYGGELLFAWSGTPGTSFGAHIWQNTDAVLNQHIFKLVFDENNLYKKYFMYALNQRVLTLIGLAHGSAGLQHVTKGVFENTLIPIPPLKEQKRIVAKIEELLPYIERYGKAEEHLTALNTTFPEALKKSILQEAVQGKLVPQNPDDEPASVLLERIIAEKQALIKAGKIKKDKHESFIITRDKIPYEIIDGKERCIADEVPFELPEGWCWCRLIDIIIDKPSNGLSPKGVDYETSVKNLTLTATTSGVFKADAFKFVDISHNEAEKYWLCSGDILIQRSNSRELVGTSCIYYGDEKCYIYPDLMMRIHTFDKISVE